MSKTESYKDKIKRLIQESPLEIDTEIQVSGKPPTMANSEFITNKEQGDWAEKIAYSSINEFSLDHFTVQYGRSDSLAAGEEGFEEFYREYQKELNTIGKKPDLLVFNKADFPDGEVDINNPEHVKKAEAAIEVRSSSFLAKKYSNYMESRRKKAIKECRRIQKQILETEHGELLKRKNPAIYGLLSTATEETFKDLDFRRPSWTSTKELKELNELLKQLKENIKILHKRDILSITPKIEDIALVNRWIQNFNVKHFYLQVFFDKAYVISFKEILQLISNDRNEETNFTIEGDVKNQNKRTIKVNVLIGGELLGKIDMPSHYSAMKEFKRGRLLFYVTFEGGKGYLDNEVFLKDVINE